ncbi:MAG TPA: HPF/RaiA family ribosome-associated protein [Dongiaceae bacterium]|nr:HPF/RaiA family ribosome-associated protein [Dongiaceae bacterium]
MQKPLQIAFKNLDKSEHLENLIRERVDKLEQFHPRLIGCRVVLEAPARSATAKASLAISVELDVPGRPKIIAKRQDERRDAKGDNLKLINQAFDAAQRQLEDMARVVSHVVKLHESTGETGCIRQVESLEDHGFVELAQGDSLYFSRDAVADNRFDDLKPGMVVHVTRAVRDGTMGPQASSIRLQAGSQAVR